MILYLLDLLGTFAFAISGAYKAKTAGLSVFGVTFLGIITAVGGGTLRDVLLGRTPLFYLRDMNYFLVAVVGGLIVYFAPVFFKRNYSVFRFIDSIGLSVFTVIGVSVSYNFLSSALNGSNPCTLFLPSVFFGMLTGFGGGTIRDAVMGDVPMSLRKGSNYTLSAFYGSLIFYIFMFYDYNAAIIVSVSATLFLREIISPFGIYKKTNNLKNI
jgi:uncharacterized membrane protein YeiH